MIERTLQRYRLLEEVGQGGMAVVYKGFDTTLNREVAVKVLHPHLAGQEESRARLQREAHAVAKLRHENILEIFDYSGPDSPESYIVTEFIHGRTLKNFLTDFPLPFPEVAEMIASEVARALEHAHSLGVIHRDVKPENVMIRDDGIVKLMDFGIAQIVDKERMTVTGQLLGSPAYMAPEHVEGRPLDFRTDVFAAGILTYQLATGQLPFRGKNPHEVLKRIAECKFAAPQTVNPLVGARLGRVIGKALEREPANRFPDVAPMRRELLEDLADAGVDDPRQELQRYFVDPKGWTKEFKPRLVARLTARGRELRAAGRTAAALELWGRALGLEPKSPELRRLVDGMARRRNLGRAGLALGVLVAVAALASWGIRWLAHRPPPPKHDLATNGNPAVKPMDVVGAHVTANENANPNGGKPPEPPKVVKHAAPHALAQRPAHPLLAVAAEAPKRKFVFSPNIRNFEITLDGARLGKYGPELRDVTLGGGAHTLLFSSEYCNPQKVVIGADQPAGEIPVELAWKQAQLVVHAKPENADVLFDGKVFHSGFAIPVTMPPEQEGPRRKVTVTVAAAGYVSKTVTVEVLANERKLQNVELEAQAE